MRHDEDLLSYIDDFNNGDQVAVVEMGGMSAAYELTIWIATFKILEAMIHNIDSDPLIDWGSDEYPSDTWIKDQAMIKNLAGKYSHDLTGAQYGAAINAATILFRNGIEDALDTADNIGRLIVISQSMLTEVSYTTEAPVEIQAEYVPSYQFNDPRWPGLAKVVEEMGELNQVIGKLMTCGGELVYPWGEKESFKDKFEEEIGDVLGALFFFMNTCPEVDAKAIINRASIKSELFTIWAKGDTEVSFDEVEQRRYWPGR